MKKLQRRKLSSSKEPKPKAHSKFKTVSGHYIQNEEFLAAMRKYIKEVNTAKKLKQPLPRVPEYIGECLLAIATHLSYKSNFLNYQFREDMISYGVENCLQYIHNFDPKRSNPFAYFTQIIFFAFVRKIQQEKKQLYVKYKTIENMLQHDVHDQEHLNIQQYGDDESDSFMREFITTFENSKEKKKKKKPKPKAKETIDMFE
jgi:DNA-directed RNA polymerase specialized sigma subunit